jgi:hypothetical protein
MISCRVACHHHGSVGGRPQLSPPPSPPMVAAGASPFQHPYCQQPAARSKQLSPGHPACAFASLRASGFPPARADGYPGGQAITMRVLAAAMWGTVSERAAGSAPCSPPKPESAASSCRAAPAGGSARTALPPCMPVGKGAGRSSAWASPCPVAQGCTVPARAPPDERMVSLAGSRRGVGEGWQLLQGRERTGKAPQGRRRARRRSCIPAR